jgi:L-fucose mutarotase
MLKTPVLHPEILSALAGSGHLGKILISDGNYPHANGANPLAKLVWANFMPGIVDANTALRMVCELVPVEVVEVMRPNREGLHAMQTDPPIWDSFRKTLRQHANFTEALVEVPKPQFVQNAISTDVCLVIATAETQIWANCLITIGVVK